MIDRENMAVNTKQEYQLFQVIQILRKVKKYMIQGLNDQKAHVPAH
jgi:hypothetical protein